MRWNVSTKMPIAWSPENLWNRVMILAINLNAAIDRIYFLDRFVPGAHNRAQKTLLNVGGKGLCVARVLKTLGAPHRAISFIAGKNGKALAKLLRQDGIDTQLIWVPGDTREANVIVETDLNQHSHITTSGYSLNRAYCDQFLDKIKEIALGAKWAVIAGTVPPGTPNSFYKEIIELLHEYGVKVLIDSFGPPLLETLSVSPDVVKMNQDEFLDTFQINSPKDLSDWISSGLRQMEISKIKALVLTCGKVGILAFTPEGIYHAGCKAQKEVNAAGAGDAASAALVHRFSSGDSWNEALPWAVATSAAVVMTEGTAECYQKDILEIYPQTWIKQI